MENKTKKSISRIMLMIFVAMMIISSTILVGPGGHVVFFAVLGFLLILILLIGVEKHRKYVCIGMAVILLIIIGDHIAGQKLHQYRIQSYYDQIEELETKAEYENEKGGSH